MPFLRYRVTKLLVLGGSAGGFRCDRGDTLEIDLAENTVLIGNVPVLSDELRILLNRGWIKPLPAVPGKPFQPPPARVQEENTPTTPRGTPMPNPKATPTLPLVINVPQDAPKPHPLQILDVAAMRTFVLAGRAIFTVLNTATNKRVTWRVEALKGEDDVYTVHAFTGSENASKSNYDLIGHIRNGCYTYRGDALVLRELEATLQAAGRKDDAGFIGKMAFYTLKGWNIYSRSEQRIRRLANEFTLGRTKVAEDSLKQKGFAWLWNVRLSQGRELGEGVEFWHEGRCGMCSRLLSVPESITAGYGPVCLPRMGLNESKAA